jgi:hypothetical protein
MNYDEASSQPEKQPEPQPPPASEDSAPLARIDGLTDWSAVLRDPPPAAAQPAAVPPAGPGTLAVWLKLAFPAVILLGYLLYKIFTADPSARTHTAGTLPDVASSISGVKPAQDDSLTLDRPTREAVARLEAHRNRADWDAILSEVSRLAPPIAEHPVVQSLAAVARTRRGERNVELEAQLTRLEARLRPAADRYKDLIHHLRIARLAQIAARATTEEVLLRNTDTIAQLLAAAPLDPFDIKIRQEIAGRYEAIGDAQVAEARGYLKKNLILLRSARTHYQTALRWLVSPSRWLELTAVSPAARPDVERLTEKIRSTNRAIHGIALPFSGVDNSTWSGRPNTPIHDVPGGTW